MLVPQASLTDTRKYGSMTALIVEDMESMCKALSQMLLLLGFKQVLQAKDGRDALRVMKDHTIDLIVSDWNMPKMSGIELLQDIRRKEQKTHVPFIMVTGNLEQDYVIKAIQCGVSEYIIKPFSQQMLKERVKRAFLNPAPGLKREALDDRYSSAEQATEPEAQVYVKPTILLVDDEPNNLHVLAGLLKQDYKIKACKSGQAALDVCSSKTPPDLILLDIMMPGLSGLDVCERLKNNPKTEAIPIIFVTALSQTQDVVKGLELGAVDYITKPITPAIVIARVQTHMRVLQQHKALASQIDTLMDNLKLQEEMERIFQHDLKNPLMAIMSSAETLDRHATHRTRGAVDLLKESSSLMAQMLDNMLTLYQLETGSYHYQPEDILLYDIIRQVLESFSSAASDKVIKIKNLLPQGLAFQGEFLLSFTMFANLIKNAIDAAPRGTEILLTNYNEAEFLVVTIHNVGEIPVSIRGRFFEKFVTSGKKGGNGIGTYSAKMIAQAQGGDIEFETSESEGTTIKIKVHRVDSDQMDTI